MVDHAGIEPAPPECKTGVLPLSLTAHGAQGRFRAHLSAFSARRFHQISFLSELERPRGNDPLSSRWRREALPLSYSRMVGRDRVERPQPKRGVYSALGSPMPSLPISVAGGGVAPPSKWLMRPIGSLDLPANWRKADVSIATPERCSPASNGDRRPLRLAFHETAES